MKKTLGWIFFCLLVYIWTGVVTMDPPIEATLRDTIGFRLYYTVPTTILGAAVLLNQLGIRQKVDALKKGLVYWLIVVILMFIPMALGQSFFCSDDFNRRFAEYSATHLNTIQTTDLQK